MAKGPGNRFRRSDLFVVRIWRADSSEPVDPAAGEAGSAEWQGRVQRAVSGEAHDFHGWPALLHVLEAMLTTARPARKGGPIRDGKESGDQAGE